MESNRGSSMRAQHRARLEEQHLHDETFDGRRLQRFLYKGMQTIEKGKDQLTVWPRSSTSTN